MPKLIALTTSILAAAVHAAAHSQSSAEPGPAQAQTENDHIDTTSGILLIGTGMAIGAILCVACQNVWKSIKQCCTQQPRQPMRNSHSHSRRQQEEFIVLMSPPPSYQQSSPTGNPPPYEESSPTDNPPPYEEPNPTGNPPAYEEPDTRNNRMGETTP